MQWLLAIKRLKTIVFLVSLTFLVPWVTGRFIPLPRLQAGTTGSKALDFPISQSEESVVKNVSPDFRSPLFSLLAPPLQVTTELRFTVLYGLINAGGSGVTVDGGGNAYAVGRRFGFDSIKVVKANADGSNLIYETLIDNRINHGGIGVDSAGNVYVTNRDGSPSVSKLSAGGELDPNYLPFTGTALDVAVDGMGNAYVTGGSYVAKSGSDGGEVYNTPLPAGGYWGIDVDAAGNAYVSGPGVVVKVNANGSVDSTWPTRAGGTDYGIALDGERNVYVTNVIGGTQTQAIKFNNNGIEAYRIDLCDNCFGRGIAVDGAGNAFITGWTSPSQDVFLAKVNSDGTNISYAKFGGSANDFAHGIFVDGSGDIYLTGGTSSSDFIPELSGPGNFILKLAVEDEEPATETPTPTHTPTDTPSPTHTFTPSPTRTATFVATATSSPSPTNTPTPSLTPTSLPTDSPTTVPTATDTPDPVVTVTDTPLPISIISGIVLLQGRATHAGTHVFVTEEPCPEAPPGLPATNFNDDSDAITNEAGYFEIPVFPDRTYQCLQLFQPGYLRGQRSLPQAGIGTLVLPGGDMNQDNIIDLSDLNLIAAHYRTAELMADLNDNGWVDVCDLSIASGNYGQVSPVTDWQ